MRGPRVEPCGERSGAVPSHRVPSRSRALLIVAVVALAVVLLLALALLRRAVEPTCPSCASRRWGPDPLVLHCSDCGWSNAADQQVPREDGQMELTLRD